MDSDLAVRLSKIAGLRPWHRAPLAPFTSVGVGGKADLLLTAADTRALTEALHLLDDAGVPWAVLGAGSNLLVPDSGFRGVVLKLDDEFHYIEDPHERAGRVTLVAGAGLPLSRLAVYVADMGLSGLEFSCGIPGSVGGGVFMNAGAHSGCMADVVRSLHVVSAEGQGWVDAALLDWRYRSSGLPEGAVITAVAFELTHGDRADILEHHRLLLGTRRRTQPRGVRTFGSTFRNPADDYAGRLLESSGLKGVRRGGAQVSTVHANFITNLGDATATDVLGLMVMMRGTVAERQGVVLEPEVRLLGAPFPWERGTAGASGTGVETGHESPDV
jgi:UDP-N-acetylmuramate dehydrogenase